MPWYVWAAIAVVAAIGEAVTLSLVLGSIALAAVVTAGVAAVAGSISQVIVFVLLSLVLLVAVRPLVLRVLPGASAEQSAPRVGPLHSQGTTMERVDSQRGQIRVGRAEFWSARAAEPGMVIEANEPVEIVRMQGLEAIVRPVDAPAIAVEKAVLPSDGTYGLSARELEVLELVAAGLSNQEIADRLVLSPRTVHHHVSHILTKMNVDSRVDAVRLALQRGIVSPAPESE